MSDTDTPKTDTLLRELNGDPSYKSLTESDAEEVVRLARKLERELARLEGRACLVCGLPNDSTCPQRLDEMSPCTFDPTPIEAAKTFLRRAEKAEKELERVNGYDRYCDGEIKRLERELAQARQDAERYRWLRVYAEHVRGFKIEWSEGEDDLPEDGVFYPQPSLDAAIDAAMKEGK